MFEIDQVEGVCPHWKIFLSGNLSFCCKVKQVREDGLALEPLTSIAFSTCLYSIKGKNKNSDNYVCFCPLRKEIFRKYGD
jgi:hypothetical protein